MARIQNHREMPFLSVTLSLTEKGVGQDRKRIYCGFLSESQQQHEAFVCRQNRADSVEKGPRGPLRAYRFSCSFNLPLRVDKPLADFPRNATDNGDSSPRGSCPDQRYACFLSLLWPSSCFSVPGLRRCSSPLPCPCPCP